MVAEVVGVAATAEVDVDDGDEVVLVVAELESSLPPSSVLDEPDTVAAAVDFTVPPVEVGLWVTAR